MDSQNRTEPAILRWFADATPARWLSIGAGLLWRHLRTQCVYLILAHLGCVLLAEQAPTLPALTAPCEAANLQAIDLLSREQLVDALNLLSRTVANKQEAERLFSALSDNGTVIMPLGKTFWAEAFGMCVDRFGIHWMVNCEH